MKKVIINNNQKGLLFKSGKFVRLLNAGKYYLFGERRVELLPLDDMLRSETCALDILLGNAAVAQQTAVAEVADQQLALHYVLPGCYKRENTHSGPSSKGTSSA